MKIFLAFAAGLVVGFSLNKLLGGLNKSGLNTGPTQTLAQPVEGIKQN